MAAVDNPWYAGKWGGNVEMRDIKGPASHGVYIGRRSGVTMSIHQAGGMAQLQIRQGHFGRICGATLSADSDCGIGVCPRTFEIPLTSSCNSTYNYGVPTDAWRRKPVDPYMLSPNSNAIGIKGTRWHMGSDAIHLDFWTHACTHEINTGVYALDQRYKTRWALWLDTAGTLEVRYVIQAKPEYHEQYWYVVGSLERCGTA